MRLPDPPFNNEGLELWPKRQLDNKCRLFTLIPHFTRAPNRQCITPHDTQIFMLNHLLIPLTAKQRSFIPLNMKRNYILKERSFYLFSDVNIKHGLYFLRGVLHFASNKGGLSCYYLFCARLRGLQIKASPTNRIFTLYLLVPVILQCLLTVFTITCIS